MRALPNPVPPMAHSAGRAYRKKHGPPSGVFTA